LGEKKLKEWKFKDSKLTREEIGKLFVRFRKEYPDFEDLVSERDKILRIMEIHSITMDALKTELKKWDENVEKEFKNIWKNSRSKN
jgi:hypothetical protein